MNPLLRDTVLDSPDGAARRLRLHVPEGPAPDRGWPMLVLLDGDWIWPPQPRPATLDTCAVLIPGHGGTDARSALAQRAMDYTPPAPGGGLWPDPRRPEWQCGGADRFLASLLGPMLDWVGTQARIDRHRLSLYGHSYGGLCALYALARQPGAFIRTICASPSLWWHGGLASRQLEVLRTTPPRHPVELILMAATGEVWHLEPADPSNPDGRRGGVPTLPALQALAAHLADIPNLRCRLERLEHLGHGDALPVSARRALALAAQ